MFLVRFSKGDYADGSGTLNTRYREFKTEDEAEKWTLSVSGDGKFSAVQIFTPIHNQLDYKAKFEELYDHLLKGSGIRPQAINKLKVKEIE